MPLNLLVAGGLSINLMRVEMSIFAACALKITHNQLWVRCKNQRIRTIDIQII